MLNSDLDWRRRPITVLVATPGRHLFEGIHDDRVQVVTPGPDRPDPDLVVFSCGNDRHFTNVPTAPLSDRTRTRIAEGAVGLVFDATTEGVKHKDHTTTELHDVLKYPARRLARPSISRRIVSTSRTTGRTARRSGSTRQ